MVVEIKKADRRESAPRRPDLLRCPACLLLQNCTLRVQVHAHAVSASLPQHRSNYQELAASRLGRQPREVGDRVEAVAPIPDPLKPTSLWAYGRGALSEIWTYIFLGAVRRSFPSGVQRRVDSRRFGCTLRFWQSARSSQDFGLGKRNALDGTPSL